MSHYIAQLIVEAESADDAHKAEAQERCAGEILKLWAQRAGYPGAERPFQSFEPVLQALKRLDPGEPGLAFFRNFRDLEVIDDTSSSDVQALLTAAVELERAAAQATRALVQKAAVMTATREAPWLAAASHITDEGTQFLESFLQQLDAGPRVGDDGSQPPDETLDTAVAAIHSAVKECRNAYGILKPSGLAGSRRARYNLPEEASILDDGDDDPDESE
jgi:hypothetical protein